MDKLQEARKIINEVDLEMARLFEERMNAVKIVAEYKKLLLGFGEERSFYDAEGLFTAVIEDVEPMGHLLLRRSNGTLSRYAFKEVEMLLPQTS